MLLYSRCHCSFSFGPSFRHLGSHLISALWRRSHRSPWPSVSRGPGAASRSAHLIISRSSLLHSVADTTQWRRLKDRRRRVICRSQYLSGVQSKETPLRPRSLFLSAAINQRVAISPTTYCAARLYQQIF